MTAPRGKSKTDARDLSFEKALERLETMVAEMESGKISLEKMMEHFEEGQKLTNFCSKKLNEIEKKLSEHDEQFHAVFKAIRHLLHEDEQPKRKIGF